MRWERTEKRKETLSLRAYNMPGPVLLFFFGTTFALLNRHFNPHFTRESTEVQRGE